MEEVKITTEALNCLRFWQRHSMYGGTLSNVIEQQMEEWVCRDKGRSMTASERENFLEEIKRGDYND